MNNVDDITNMLNELKNMASSFKHYKNTQQNEQTALNTTENKHAYIILDLETTTYKDIIQVAYTIYDNLFQKIKHVNVLVNEGIGQIDHYKKFSLDDIFTHGKNPTDVLLALVKDMESCEYMVCHNIIFDSGIIYKYLNKYNITISQKPKHICTMKSSKTYCNARDKRGWLKHPSLKELYFKCFNKYPDETKTHSADYDIFITKQCFKFLVTNNIIVIDQ